MPFTLRTPAGPVRVLLFTLLLLSVFLSTSITPALAEPPDNEDEVSTLKKQMEQLEERLDELEKSRAPEREEGDKIEEDEGAWRWADEILTQTRLRVWASFHYSNLIDPAHFPIAPPPTYAITDDISDPHRLYISSLVFSLEFHFTDSIRAIVDINGWNEIYLEWQPSNSFRVRAGMQPTSLGFVRADLVPTSFAFVSEPTLSWSLFPRNMRRITGEISGSVGILDYTLDVGTGISLFPYSWADFENLATSGIGGNYFLDWSGQLNNPSTAGSVNIQFGDHLVVGAGAFWGKNHSSVYIINGTTKEPSWAGLATAEGHFRVEFDDFQIRGLYASTWMIDASELNDFLRARQGNPPGFFGYVPSRMHGGYFEYSWNFLALAAPQTNQRLFLALRVELLDLQADLPANTVRVAASEQQIYTAGLTWFPIPKIALKADFKLSKFGGKDETGKAANVALAFRF